MRGYARQPLYSVHYISLSDSSRQKCLWAFPEKYGNETVSLNAGRSWHTSEMAEVQGFLSYGV